MNPTVEGQGRIVLVVDDDVDQVEALEGALTEAGYCVRTAGDGATGVRSVCQSAPDLILMDIDMPVLDGTSAARQMRQDPAVRHVPIIFVSGTRDLLPRVRDLGLDDTDFLQKPYSIDQLLLRVQRTFAHTETKRRPE